MHLTYERESYICALNILSHWNLIIRTKGYLKVFSKGFSDYFIAHVIAFQNHNSIENLNAINCVIICK